MINVRNNVFETNSSSTHSITMCEKTIYEKWVSGNALWKRWECTFVETDDVDRMFDALSKDTSIRTPIETLRELYASNKEEFFELLYEYYDYYTFENYCSNICYETYSKQFTTSGGETIVAFGYYGYDN